MIASLNDLRAALKERLEQEKSDLFSHVRLGPRHNEVSFETRAGENIVLSVRKGF